MNKDNIKDLSLVAIVGSDSTKKKELLSRFKALLDVSFFDFNYRELLYGDALTTEEILEACLSLPVGDVHRIVVFNFDKNLNEGFRDAMQQFYDKQLEGVTVVLYGNELLKTTKLYKLLSSNTRTRIFACDLLQKSADVEAFVRQEIFGKAGYEIEPTACKEFVKRIGNDTGLLQQSFKNLAVSIPDKKSVSLSDIQKYVPWLEKIMPWDFADAVCARNIDTAMQLLSQMKKIDHMSLLINLENKLRELICYKSSKMSREDPVNVLNSSLSMISAQGKRVPSRYKSWMMKSLASYASNYSEQELVRALALCLDCEEGIKGGLSDKDTCLIDTVLKIMQ